MKLFPIFLALMHPLHYFAQIVSPVRTRINPDYALENRPQADRLKQFQAHHAKILAIWAVINLLAGGISMFFSEGEIHQFHHMNAAWGSINLIVAGLLWYKIRQISLALPTTILVTKSQSFRRFLIANLGLDLSFIAIGYWLHQKGSHSIELLNLYRGFGNSVMLQGLGLLALDLSTLLPYSTWLKRHSILPLK